MVDCTVVLLWILKRIKGAALYICQISLDCKKYYRLGRLKHNIILKGCLTYFCVGYHGALIDLQIRETFTILMLGLCEVYFTVFDSLNVLATIFRSFPAQLKSVLCYSPSARSCSCCFFRNDD